MICALNFVNNEKLPENKIQLYEQCCEMLMDARDSQRNIDINIYENIPQFDYSMKRRILEEIAYRMLSNDVPSESRENIVDFLQNLLANTNIISDNKNYNMDNILDFLIERSGVIRAPEKGIIDFIHKTFMEFLAVKTICRNCNWDVLVKEACNVNWKETIVMCFAEMSNNNVNYVLTELVKKGKQKKNDRYFLMASLCVSNARFFYSEIKDEIDNKIKEMIPPNAVKIEEMAEMGSYLLPFLKDSEKYDEDQKFNCLYLLSMLKMKETIPLILTYLRGDTYIGTYKYSADLLWSFAKEELAEYNVKEYLIKILIDSIQDKKLFTCETILYLLNDYTSSTREREKLKSIKSIIILCQKLGETKFMESNFGKYFEECENIKVVGDIEKLLFLNGFKNIKNIEIISDARFSILINELNKLGNLDNVKSLFIDTKYSDIYLINRLNQNMKNVESIEISLRNKNLTMYTDTLDCFLNLKKIVFNVDESLAKEIQYQSDKLKGNNKNLVISVNNIS